MHGKPCAGCVCVSILGCTRNPRQAPRRGDPTTAIQEVWSEIDIPALWLLFLLSLWWWWGAILLRLFYVVATTCTIFFVCALGYSGDVAGGPFIASSLKSVAGRNKQSKHEQ